jgi:hypothetical protein
VAGGVGGVVASLVNWKIEERKQKQNHRQELVAKWRKMLNNIAQSDKPLAHIVEIQEDFYSLRPHLQPLILDKIGLTESLRSQGAEIMQQAEITIAGIVHDRPIKNSSTFRMLMDEIDRIERDWNLV